MMLPFPTPPYEVVYVFVGLGGGGAGGRVIYSHSLQNHFTQTCTKPLLNSQKKKKEKKSNRR